jgi:sugar diacid utilization regulator
LTYNVRISGAIIAVLNINELYGEIKNADYYYIMMVASYLRKLLRSKTIQPRNVNLDAELSELMNTLLSRNLLPENHIKNILKKNDWKIDNRFVCVCLELQRFDDPNYQNAVLVSSLYDKEKTYIYTFYDKYLVIIYNLSQMNVTFSNFINDMTPILKNTDTYAGISLAFQDFKNLYYYYDQATFALSLISDAASPEQRIVNYHDYIADYAVQNCLKQNINLSYVPLGLLRLMAYDEKKNSNFTHMLKVYLENERNITKTVESQYISRSTFLYQIKKIENILDMDLNDPNTRFVLMFAMKILGIK